MNKLKICFILLGLFGGAQVSLAQAQVAYVTKSSVRVDFVRTQFIDFDFSPNFFKGYLVNLQSEDLLPECAGGYAYGYFADTNIETIPQLGSFDIYKIILNTVNAAVATDLSVNLGLKKFDNSGDTCYLDAIGLNPREEAPAGS